MFVELDANFCIHLVIGYIHSVKIRKSLTKSAQNWLKFE
jgi:hypothetical protein